MKSTIELPDDLFFAAKQLAVRLRKPLKSLIEAGLRSQVYGESSQKSKKSNSRVFKWLTVKGGLPEELDLSDRENMHYWIQKNK